MAAVVISRLIPDGYKPTSLKPRIRATSYLSSAVLASHSLNELSHCSVVGLPNMFSITTTVMKHRKNILHSEIDYMLCLCTVVLIEGKMQDYFLESLELQYIVFLSNL